MYKLARSETYCRTLQCICEQSMNHVRFTIMLIITDPSTLSVYPIFNPRPNEKWTALPPLHIQLTTLKTT